jgi:outer membrane receptor for ferrienterochelin and colicin
MNKRYMPHGVQPRRTALTVALAMGLGFTGLAFGQATTGSIFGTAPAGTGESVVVKGANGATREVAVGTDGRYSVNGLPVGRYSVSLQKDGQVLASQDNVTVSPGGGTSVPFAAASTSNAQNLGAVQVVASALPAIDVTSVNSSTIITAADLAKLPVQRSAESIALLAPSTVRGSSYFANGGNAVAFGGSSVSENAYYVNGYNTGEPYKNIGGFQLPYGAIDQQETLTGGYSAKYGRSDGGVINQIGKRGTNEWHFGGQVVWQPRYLEASPRNNYYGNPAIPAPVGGSAFVLEHPDYVGTLRQYRNDNKEWETVYSAYVGGPLIKDKLFMFLAAETSKTQSTDVQNFDLAKVAYNTDKNTKFYGKLDWNITDNNVLELTALKNRQSYGTGKTYDFNYDTLQAGDFVTNNDVSRDNAQFYIAHFTSYITDNATLSVLYGKAKFQDPTMYGNTSPLPFISRKGNENPAYLPPGSTGINNDQTNTTWQSNAATNNTHGLRVDFDYKLGDHDLSVGIDNMNYGAKNQGPSFVNPNNPAQTFYWRYLIDGKTGEHYVQSRQIGWQTSMTMAQKAYYLQDAWQITPTFLLNVGIRNDHFTNNNDQGIAFVDEKNQWEPRIGASWDVNGDSSFKIYGNVGRYYLALPDNAAERAANISTYLTQNFTYTGIDPATGEPTGLQPRNDTTGGAIVSPDGEKGLPKDPEQVTARNLKPEYVDEFILGFDKQLNDQWNYGAKAMWRDLKAAIDDECSPGRIDAKMTAMGIDTTNYYDSLYGASYCRLFNPGQTNTMLIRGNAGSGAPDQLISMSTQDWGFDRGAVRKIGSLNLYMEHPFDGKWQARIDYTWTRGFGNTEGQVRSDFGQGDVSKTEDWDSAELMQGQYGELFNVRKHQIRLRGNYQITPEWLVSATMLAQSGVAKECLGYYGPDASGDPTGYNNGGSGNYHWCAGKIVHPGDPGHTPWTFPLNIGVHYTPAFADHKLAFNMDIFNAFNQQRGTQYDPTGEAGDHVINNTYNQPIFYEQPRMIRLSVSYDY